MMAEAENRLRARLIMLLVWSGSVLTVMFLGAGFAGGIERAYADNPPAWLVTASPLIPMVLWLRARAACRLLRKGEDGDSHQ